MDLLDTDILIDIQRGYEPAIIWFEQLDEMPHIPGFVVMELIQDAPDKRAVNEVMDLIKPLPVVWPDLSDCERALEVFYAYHLSHGLGLLDALIASTALGRNASLYTFNTKHFRVFPELNIPVPYPK